LPSERWKSIGTVTGLADLVVGAYLAKIAVQHIGRQEWVDSAAT
jgi:hypothetical protein